MKNYFKILKHDLCALCILAIIFSFLGFLLDNLINLIKTGIINNDSFVLPFNASYGFMAFLFYFIETLN